MGEDGQQRQAEGEAVDDAEEQLEADDDVDETSQRLFGNDGVLLNELGEVVEARGCHS